MGVQSQVEIQTVKFKMVKVKLTYFNIMGRAETLRWLMLYGGQDFEDHRIEFSEWPQIKQKMKTGQVPLLEYDGEEMYQTMAIMRFLAKEFNLYGKTNKDQYKADMIADCVGDFLATYVKFKTEKDEDKKSEMIKTWCDETAPKFFSLMEGFMKDNGGKCLVGDCICYVDIFLSAMLDILEAAVPECTKLFPKCLVDLRSSIKCNPRIKAYLD